MAGSGERGTSQSAARTFPAIDAKVDAGSIVLPLKMSPWFALLDRRLSTLGAYNPSILALEILEELVAHGWTPPDIQSGGTPGTAGRSNK